MGISGLGKFPRADVVSVMEGKLNVLGGREDLKTRGRKSRFRRASRPGLDLRDGGT